MSSLAKSTYVKGRVSVSWHFQLTITLFDYHIVALNPSNSANWLDTPTLLLAPELSPRAGCLRRRDALSAFQITGSVETCSLNFLERNLRVKILSLLKKSENIILNKSDRFSFFCSESHSQRMKCHLKKFRE